MERELLQVVRAFELPEGEIRIEPLETATSTGPMRSRWKGKSIAIFFS